MPADCGEAIKLAPASGFQPCQTPHNKGRRRPGWSRGTRAETQFKPEHHQPHIWKPIGSMRLSKDGYLQRKVPGTGSPPRDWVAVHILVREQEHGPVPQGHAVAFKDRNKANICRENLELLSRCELMRRNTIHNDSPQPTSVIRLNTSLKRKLRSLHEEHTDGLAQPPV